MKTTERISNNRLALPLIIIYLVSTALFMLGKKQLLQWGADPSVLIAGNTILFGASLASLRYLGQRLRQRLPQDAPLLIGIWPVKDEELGTDRITNHIGADYFASCMQEAVNACVETARKPVS